MVAKKTRIRVYIWDILPPSVTKKMAKKWEGGNISPPFCQLVITTPITAGLLLQPKPHKDRLLIPSSSQHQLCLSQIRKNKIFAFFSSCWSNSFLCQWLALTSLGSSTETMLKRCGHALKRNQSEDASPLFWSPQVARFWQQEWQTLWAPRTLG